MAPEDIKRAVTTANEAVVKSYHISPDQLPLVLNGRARQLVEENERLRRELARKGIIRLPAWMVAANLVLIALLLVNLLILALTH
jgi:hypothetical protein